MGEHITLTSADGHSFDAYVARPAGEPIAALVIAPEIFGINAHIRSVVDGYAKDGFLAIAPAIFDRFERGLDLGYEGADMEKALTFVPKLDMDKFLLDIDASLAYGRKETGKKAGVIGYCLGGTLAWLSSTRLNPDAAVGYYGGHIALFVTETPKVPLMLNFGTQDTHIPQEVVNKVKELHPEVPVYLYDADHGFNCDARGSYNAAASKEARERSLEFLKTKLA